MSKNNRGRPILLSLSAIIMILIGIVTTISGAFLMAGGVVSLPIAQPEGIGILAFGALVLLGGIFSILVGLALFSGKKWGWWFAVIMTAISLVLAIISTNYVGLIIYLIVLLYLLTNKTRRWFEV